MNENLKRHRPDIKAIGEGKALAFMPEDPMGVWVHIQEVRDLLEAKDNEIAGLKKKLVEYEDCAANACAERDDNQTAIDELNADNAAIAALKRQIEFLKTTHDSCGHCSKCADGMGKVFDENLAKLKADYKEACDRLQTANLIKDEQKAKADKLLSCLKCLVMRALIKDCPEKAAAIEIVKKYGI